MEFTEKDIKNEGVDVVTSVATPETDVEKDNMSAESINFRTTGWVQVCFDVV